MILSILPSLSALVIALTLLLFIRKEGSNQPVFLILIYEIGYITLLFLPITYRTLAIPETSMNWSGKVLAILFSVTFYYFTRIKLGDKDYITNPVKFPLKVLMVGAVTLAIMCLLSFSFSNGKEVSLERLAYQLTMPGLDEELWRGILIGFIAVIVKKESFKFGHPGVWITTFAFAIGHSVFINEWSFSFAADAFIVSGVLGYIFGWMIVKSKSIVPAIILHNLINFSSNLIEMYLI